MCYTDYCPFISRVTAWLSKTHVRLACRRHVISRLMNMCVSRFVYTNSVRACVRVCLCIHTVCVPQEAAEGGTAHNNGRNGVNGMSPNPWKPWKPCV